LGLDPYLRLTGLAYQVSPLINANGDAGVSTDVMYDNVVNKFRWGGLDTAKPGHLYLDETVSRMVTTMRSALLDLANSLMSEGVVAQNNESPLPAGMTREAYVADRYKKAGQILDMMMEKMPIATCPFAVQMGEQVARTYYKLGEVSGNQAMKDKGNKILEVEIMRYAGYLRYYQSLSPAMYERLSRIDKIIDQQHMLDMLSDYGQQCGDAQYEKLATKLAAAGVNMGRLQSYQRAYEEKLMRQYQERQEQQQTQE
jgi:hypothetical protein